MAREGFGCRGESAALLADFAPCESGEDSGARYVRRASSLAELLARHFHVAGARELRELLPSDPATDQDMHQGSQPLAGRCEDLFGGGRPHERMSSIA